MTDPSMDDTERRVGTALNRLADDHHPDTDGHWPASHPNAKPRPSQATSRHRWLLAAASIVIVVAGVTAVAVVQRSDESPTTGTTPALTTPALTTTVGPTTSVTDPIPDPRFGAPLDPGTVATMDPAPATPVAAYDLDVGGDEWADGRDNSSNIWVLSENDWVGSLIVIDQAVPWEVATDGYTPTNVNGVDAVVDEGQSAVALKLGSGGTRVIRSNNGGPSQPEMMKSAIDLAELVGGGPVDVVLPANQFVVPVGISSQSPLVRYGSPDNADETIELIVYRLDRTPTEDELRWMATSMSQGNTPERINAVTFESTLDAGQRSLLELVSPLDIVAILAPPDTDITALRDALVLEPLTQTGLTVEQINPVSTPNVVASGEQNWGRWQVATSDDQGCRSVSYTVWTAGDLSPTPSGASTCDPETPFGQTICAAAGPGRSLVIALGVAAEAVEVELDGEPVTEPISNGDGGAALLVDGVAPGSNRITIRIDGAETTCTPVA